VIRKQVLRHVCPIASRVAAFEPRAVVGFLHMVGERLGVREGLDAAGTVESLRVHFSLMRSRPWVLLVLMVWRLLTVLRLLVPLLVQLLLLLLLMKRRMVRWGSVFPKVVLTGLSVSHVRAQHVGLVERGGICSGVVQVVVALQAQTTDSSLREGLPGGLLLCHLKSTTRVSNALPTVLEAIRLGLHSFSLHSRQF
jgi:hypothetical protein